MIWYTLILFSYLFSLELIDQHIEQVLSGDISKAVSSLPNYEVKYPNNPEVIYLSGLLEVDGNSAKEKFAHISNNHKGSKYSVDSIIKVAEYYYTSGLYLQSAEWLKKVPRYHSTSKNLEKSINLFINSLLVSGNTDSAIYYSKIFEKQFPDIEFEKFSLQKKEVHKETVLSKPDLNQTKDRITTKKSKNIIVKIQDFLNRVQDDLSMPINEYSLQTGAFGKKVNAEQQEQILLDNGYDARIESINSNGILLYIVRVGYFSNHSDAKQEKQSINSNLDINPVIIKNE